MVKKRIVSLLGVAVVSSCNFEQALDSYCADNPACADAGLSVSVDGGSIDGGSVGSSARVTAVSLSFADGDNQLCGHVTPLAVILTTEDGGAPERVAVTFESTGVVQVLGDGGATFSAPWVDAQGFRFFSPGTTQVRAVVTRGDGTRLTSRTEPRRCRGRLELRPGGPYTPFTCVPFTVEVVGEGTADRISGDGRRVQLRSQGTPFIVSTDMACVGLPMPDLSVVSGVAIGSRRVDTAFTLSAHAEPDSGVDDSLASSWRPLPLEATLAVTDGGREWLVNPSLELADGGPPFPQGTCVPVTLSWRHLEQVPGLVARATQPGDVFPFEVTTMGAFALYRDASCTSRSSAQLLADGGVARVSLFAIRTAGPYSLQVSYPDGGASRTWSLGP